MSGRRFHVRDLTPDLVVLSSEQAHHAVHVLRLGVGDEIVLFDGQGGEAAAVIRTVSSNSVEVDILRRVADRAAAGPGLTLAVAAPKGTRGDWMVEKCAELGVARLCLLRTRRGKVEPGPARLERWRRKAVEAARQSRRNVVMAVDSVRPIGSRLDALDSSGPRWFADPTAGNRSFVEEVVHALQGGPRGAAWLAIGPEGGFAPDEIGQLSAAGVRPVRLGSGILRVETAAVAAAAIWNCLASGSEIPRSSGES